ncbi:MAG: hypothetical protein IPH31_23785 [Lewinellaceae bacterium]|nr:hypothetical protein [Lewinellaceae bacterium]
MTQNIGYSDVWLVKLDSVGEIEWDKSYGGINGADRAFSIQLTKDGGYIFAGETNSSDGDVEGHHGNDDCWVVKLDSNGDLEWQRALGGIGSDRGWGVVQTSDEGYAMVGYAGSLDGDITGWQGYYDYWVVKLSASGVLEWQKTLGGSDEDWGRSICQTVDDGYAVVGITRSMDGDVLVNHGQDVWAVKLDSTGNCCGKNTRRHGC